MKVMLFIMLHVILLSKQYTQEKYAERFFSVAKKSLSVKFLTVANNSLSVISPQEAVPRGV